MDTLGARRRAKNLPAISLQWGPWADVGMAARAGTSEGFLKGFGGGRWESPPQQSRCSAKLLSYLILIGCCRTSLETETAQTLTLLCPCRQHRPPGSRAGLGGHGFGAWGGQLPPTSRPDRIPFPVYMVPQRFFWAGSGPQVGLQLPTVLTGLL